MRAGGGGPFPRELSGWDLSLATNLHLVPRLRMNRAVLPLPPSNSCRVHLPVDSIFNSDVRHSTTAPLQTAVPKQQYLLLNLFQSAAVYVGISLSCSVDTTAILGVRRSALLS